MSCVASCEKSCERLISTCKLQCFVAVSIALQVAEKIASCNRALRRALTRVRLFPEIVVNGTRYSPSRECVEVNLLGISLTLTEITDNVSIYQTSESVK